MRNYLGRFKRFVTGAAAAAAPSSAPTYDEQLSREGVKWGNETQTERTERWINWLQHPVILDHYVKKGLIDGQPWEQWVKTALGGPATKSLELGCGPAHGSLRIFSAGSSNYLEGLDVSEEAVEQGERSFASVGAPGKVWVGDVNQVQLAENSYDLIFACHSFHHFLNLEHVMAQVQRALTPRGLFILDEFTGPTQFQWTDQQLEMVRALLALLPDRLRQYPWQMRKDFEPRPTPAEVVAVSPFESIRSAEIYRLFQENFEVVVERSLGGTLQHLLYNNIAHNFDPDDPEANRIIHCVESIETKLIETGLLSADFMLLIGKRRDT
jgi:SAM-dependent methyltransferase